MAQDKWLVDGPTTIDIDDVRRLKVGLVGGHVDVIGHDEAGARIEVHSVGTGKPLRISLDGDRLEIDHAQRDWDNWLDVFRNSHDKARVDISIVVPRDVALTLGVVTATALVSGIHEDATLSTISGEVAVDGMAGDLKVNSISGEVSVRNHYGKVVAKTVSGGLTVSGEVLSFTGDTVSGDVFFDLGGIPNLVRMNSVSGSITARLDSAVPAQYTISTISGRLQLDDAQITGVNGRYQGKYGDLEHEWLDLRVKTVSGDVSVMHAVAA